ncbi:hypothetical protein [Sutcliffiella deserti]|uniref:hypothetical protein n=1 Tax=Sutcliffiella deserti TaxID=2875501 RepID=UPI001CBEF89F|nr:hypothetical protein [Sutcliffiella deserti]
MSLYFEWRKSCGCRVPCNCKTSTKSTEAMYYSAQTKEAREIPPEHHEKLLTLEVKTKFPKERIKLDSILSILLETGTVQEYSYYIEFTLWRNDILITTQHFASLRQLGQIDQVKTIIGTMNISWTDYIASPGSYIYTVKAKRSDLLEENLTNVKIKNGTLNALVMPSHN